MNNNQFIPRALGPVLKKTLAGFPSVIITGPRQSGKTTFLRQTLGKTHEYISFDDPLQRQFATEDPRAFLSRFRDKRVILDEVQYVPHLFSYLKMEIDQQRHLYGRWVMTGSQHFALMKNISDSLAGRIAILELLPFHIGESRLRLDIPLQELIWRGAFPSLVISPENRNTWLSSYIQTYLERDVRQMENIRDLKVFEQFLGLTAARHGQEMNRAALSRLCGISQPTVREWLSVMEASYTIFSLPPYFENFGKRLVKTSKLYFVDSAIAAYLTRQSDAGAMWAGPMGGAFFEGWIILELVKMIASAGVKPDLYFWRSNDGMEVDLVIRHKGLLCPVEIKRTATPMPRHLDMLKRFVKAVGPSHCGRPVLVCCTESAIDLGGIAVRPWRDFLRKWSVGKENGI